MTLTAARHPVWHDGVDWPTFLDSHALPARADVVIIGGGYTGLWTALWLKELEPSLDVVVIESERVGFGASSRNGGWVSALMPMSLERVAELAGGNRDAAMNAAAVMRTMVRDLGDVAESLGIACDYQRSGTLIAARTPVQEQRARDDIAHARHWGDTDTQWLPALSAAKFAQMDQMLGATFTPHCASVQPAKLVTGLARVVAQRGVSIVEGTRVFSHGDGRVLTEHGEVKTRVVVRATEGYTNSLPDGRRTFAPVFSLMIATAPLPADVLESVGILPGLTFADHRHLVTYGQRTADDRIAFGGRGAPYHFGSNCDAKHEQVPSVHAAIHRILIDLFPVLRDVPITHTWGGALAVPRDWTVSMGYDAQRGFAWSGGYLGDGVTMSFTGGRVLAELITGRRTALSDLPWVGHHSPRWEPEPLRWLGVTAGLKAMSWADTEERLTRKPSRVASFINSALNRGG